MPNDERDPEPRFVLDLAQALSSHFDVCVLAPMTPGADATDSTGSVEIRRYRYAPLRSLETLTHPGAILDRVRQRRLRWGLVPLLMAGLHRGVRQLLAERDFACVHAHWLVPQGLVQSAFSDRERHPPFIAVGHGGDVYTMTGPLRSALMGRVLSRASGLTVVSQALATHLSQRFPVEMSTLPTMAVGSGVDLSRFSPGLRHESLPEELGLRRPLIVFAGRLSPKKGVDVLLAAMAHQPLQSSSASLLIVGDGPEEERLKSLAMTLRLEGRVRFLPGRPHAELAVILASADLFCAPSVTAADSDAEGRPTVLVEAAASGLAAVASGSDGVREWIGDGAIGQFVPEREPVALGTALAQLLAQSDRRARMGVVARMRAEAVSWPAVAERYASFTERVLDARSGRVRHSDSAINS